MLSAFSNVKVKDKLSKCNCFLIQHFLSRFTITAGRASQSAPLCADHGHSETSPNRLPAGEESR